MRSILFTLKHLFRNAVFPAFLVLTIALPALAGLAAQHALLPPAAVYAEDPSDPDTARFVKCLSEAGFRVAESREELEYGVSMEHFDAGLFASVIEKLAADGRERIMTIEVFEDDYRRSINAIKRSWGNKRCLNI